MITHDAFKTAGRLPADYLERVYAGVLGKVVGVYLGRPFEQWSHERILKELGEIWYYVHERLKVPLIVTDDDITGTFAFIRAVQEHGYPERLTAEMIGQTWLNQIIENKTILWWGGVGMSTEHTAYLRLKAGMSAPYSGSIAANGKTVAEQIGAQIFIDGWAMLAPADPARAAVLARAAASVSHDGEAVDAAVLLAVMESAAFVEHDLNTLLDLGLSFVPAEGTIATLIRDLRECRTLHEDWKKGLELIHAKYSYQHYPSNCHIVPNHAVVMLGLLWGNDDFQRALMITNTAGYDTDCNSGNVGCLLGIKNGLAGIDTGPDWRGPVADRILLPTADSGEAITDMARVAVKIANTGRRLVGTAEVWPKNGARFHFSLPGSVQGFVGDASIESAGTVRVEHAQGALSLAFQSLAEGRVARATTATFMSKAQSEMAGYSMIASPTLWPGQLLRARVSGIVHRGREARLGLLIRHFDAKDELHSLAGPSVVLRPEESGWLELNWKVPEIPGAIAEVGFELRGTMGATGVARVDFLDWKGAPTVLIGKKHHGGPGAVGAKMWSPGVDSMPRWSPADFAIIKNVGPGMLSTGTCEWTDYSAEVEARPMLCRRAGVAVRVQGLRRYYGLQVSDDGTLALLRMNHTESVLAKTVIPWCLERKYRLRLEAIGDQLTGFVDGAKVLTASDSILQGGGVGLMVEDGFAEFGPVEIRGG